MRTEPILLSGTSRLQRTSQHWSRDLIKHSRTGGHLENDAMQLLKNLALAGLCAASADAFAPALPGARTGLQLRMAAQSVRAGRVKHYPCDAPCPLG